jgi:hypothetical protein
MICYLDDDVDQDLLIRLAAKQGHQLISPRAVGHSGDSDALQFLYAASRGMPILTRNASDFEALHEFAIGIGGRHAGLIIIYDEHDRRKNMRPPEIVAALSNLESASSPLLNQLVALNHFR